MGKVTTLLKGIVQLTSFRYEAKTIIGFTIISSRGTVFELPLFVL